MKRTILTATVLAFAGLVPSSAVQTVRELWDNVPGGQLRGRTNGTTSLGFFAGSAWIVNTASPAATNVLMIDSLNDIQGWQLGLYDVLPASAGDVGTMSLATGNTNGWDSGSWAVRLMASSAWINFNANSTNYFSARLLKRGLWWGSDPNNPASSTNNYGPDDAALGLGFAAGSTTGSRFVGAGFTRTVAYNGGGGFLTPDGSTDIGDTLYVTTGTLGQAGYANHPADSGGPYFVRAYATNFVNGVVGYLSSYPYMNDLYVNGGVVVGRIITSTSGDDELAIRVYTAGETPPADISTVNWDIVYNFAETVTMNCLLVWMHGNNNGNPCWLDAIRVAKTWAEIVGVEVVGPPTASPTNTVYSGTPVTFSVFANLDAANGAYQWMKAGTYIPDATAATYTNSNPGTSDSGNYSVVFSNYFGVAVTSEVRTLTVLAAIPPFVITQPVPATRLAGAPSATFSVVADGAQPFTYQWKHVVGSTTNILSGETNQALILTNIDGSKAGSYFVTIGNWIGSTNSATAALTVLVPAPGSFAAAVVANGPYAYWRMDETNGTVLQDCWAGYDGTVLDPEYVVTNIVEVPGDPPTYTTNTIVSGVTLGVDGAKALGFPSDHRAVQIRANGYQARVNMPGLPVYTNAMTFCCWLYTPGARGDGFLMNRDLANEGGYGIANGLKFTGYVSGGTTNYNQLGYQWGGRDVNPTAWWNGHTWTNSGLYVPVTNWTFVALVLDGTSATIYMGTNNAPLTVANATLPSAVDTTFPGTSYSNSYPLLIGRSGWPWAENSTNNAWGNANVSLSDIAIFYSPLSSASVCDLYLSAVGQALTYTYSAGNLLLYWPAGTLQAAPEVIGVYTNVTGATSPYPVPITGARKFYRVKR